MRGKALTCSRKFHYTRITPAYAGKSSCDWFRRSNCWDHPRLCGEKCTRTERKLLPAGSPPPMRGKAVNAHVTFLHVGITPAYAGKSTRKPPRRRAFRDHPRLCGEKKGSLIVINFNTGSPPPMRGKGGVKVLSATERRITPAYAGKRSAGLVTRGVAEDHPRLCGEK